MSIFQKITNLLFEENDVDVIAEDELEDISLQEEEKQKEKRLAKAAAAEKEAKQTAANQQPQPKKQEAKLEDSSELKKAVRIDLKEEKDSKKATASKRSYSSVSHRSTVLEEQKEFEFTPVISPIFGASDVETDKAKKNTSVLLPKSKKQNPLGTVISPYYGLGELEEMEEQAKEDILRKAEKIERPERCSHRRRAAPYMERQGRSGRRERLLAGLLHLLHPLCSTGVRPGTAAGMAAI